MKAPFVIEGSLQGALGATMALGLLGAMFLIVHSRLDGELAMSWASSRRFCRGLSCSG